MGSEEKPSDAQSAIEVAIEKPDGADQADEVRIARSVSYHHGRPFWMSLSSGR